MLKTCAKINKLFDNCCLYIDSLPLVMALYKYNNVKGGKRYDFLIVGSKMLLPSFVFLLPLVLMSNHKYGKMKILKGVIMKSFRMRMTSIVLSVLLLASMVIPAFAADSPECLSASSFSGAEVAFFESQGIDFGKVVKISYENTAITAVDSKTRSKMTNDVDFIRFDMKDGNVITSTSIIFTDESGNPVSARSVMNGSIFNYGSQSGSVSYQHITATIRYILYTDGLTITCVNPGYVGVSMSVACSSLTADYLAYGYLTVYTPSGSGYTYTQSATTMYASIPLVRANTVAGVVYSATGSWNGYCLPTNQGVALVHDITVGHPHTVSYDYTTSSGVRYYGGLAF